MKKKNPSLDTNQIAKLVVDKATKQNKNSKKNNAISKNNSIKNIKE